MASTYTTSLRANKQGTGDALNTWGLIQNSGVFDLFDTAIAGVSTITITSDYTLSSLNGQADEARAAQLSLIGSPAANFTVYIPGVPKMYRVSNATGKVATVRVVGGGGAAVTIDSGDIIDVETDGVDVKTPGVGGLSWKAYISAVIAAGSSALPSVVGQSGKYLTNNGSVALWQTINTTDMGDYSTNIIGKQVALAVAL